MTRVALNPADVEITAMRSTVRVRHIPTGIVAVASSRDHPLSALRAAALAALSVQITTRTRKAN